MLEKDITACIIRYLKTLPGCFCWKQYGGMYGTAGLPDVICCINGMFVAFEVKTITGRLSKLQAATLARISKAGGGAFKVTGVPDVKAALKSLEVLNAGRLGLSGQKGGGDPGDQGL
jgi:hypothetical protein